MNLGFLFLFFEDLFVDFFTLFTKIFNAFDELVVVVLEGGALGSLLNNEKKNSWNGQTGFCQDRMEKQERRTKKSERTLETTWVLKDTAARKTGRRRVCSQTYHLESA